MNVTLPTPQHSRSSSGTKSPRSPLTLDLSDLPPLIQPSPPSNTLIITNLQELEIFQPSNLVQIRETINQHGAIHTWAPLKSFRRIVVSFFDDESAIAIRQTLDGEQLMGCRIRVYFGLHTPLNPSDQHLPLPKSDKLFFISPPPSPPMGWEMQNEGAPNTIAHAEDLAVALSRLHANSRESDYPSPTDDGNSTLRRRRTGSSTIVYHPEDHGDSPHLPAIAVEDTTVSPVAMSPTTEAMEGVEGPIAQQKAQGKTVSTTRPPVELMN